MYILTNRVLHKNKLGLSKFGKEPSSSGPNELRLVKVTGVRKHTVEILDDKLSQPEVLALKSKYKLAIDENRQWHASLKVACEVYSQALKEKKHILFFIHGYNNDIEDVINAANDIQSKYGVIVIPISWPANGGGTISGSAAYLSDKGDARSSSTAIHRAVEKIQNFHQLLTEGQKNILMEEANKRYPDNSEKARQLFTRKINQKCFVSINLLCHSMGNYVLKYASLPGDSSLRHLVFDNICLIAADANNPGHELWIENLQVRNRLYVVINENDGALKWSRRKPGDEQKPRLGNYLRNLSANNAYYIDVTHSKGVSSEHSYFKGKTVRDNSKLLRLFDKLFKGQVAEPALNYFSDLNLYRLK